MPIAFTPETKRVLTRLLRKWQSGGELSADEKSSIEASYDFKRASRLARKISNGNDITELDGLYLSYFEKRFVSDAKRASRGKNGGCGCLLLLVIIGLIIWACSNNGTKNSPDDIRGDTPKASSSSTSGVPPIAPPPQSPSAREIPNEALELELTGHDEMVFGIEPDSESPWEVSVTVSTGVQRKTISRNGRCLNDDTFSPRIGISTAAGRSSVRVKSPRPFGNASLLRAKMGEKGTLGNSKWRKIDNRTIEYAGDSAALVSAMPKTDGFYLEIVLSDGTKKPCVFELDAFPQLTTD